MNRLMHRFLSAVSISCCLFALAACPPTLLGQDRETEARPGSKESLAQLVTLEAIEVSLADIARQLGGDTGIEIGFDSQEMDAYGIDTTLNVVTAELRGVPLRHALNWILAPFDLTWRRRGAAIEITTPDTVTSDSAIAVIDVSELVRGGDSSVDQEVLERLVELVMANIEPATWSDVGGYGAVKRYRGRLLIHHRPEVISRVREFLAALRAAKETAVAHTESAPPRISIRADAPDQPQLDAALRRPFGLKVEERPMHEVIKEIQVKHRIPLILDLAAIEDAELKLDQPVTVVGGNELPLQEALNQICRGNDFDWTIREGALVLTAVDHRMLNYDLYLETRLYPVLDLLGDELPGDDLDDIRRDFDYDDVRELLTSAVDVTSWEDVGGPAVVTAEPEFGLLIISQSSTNHQAIAQLLGKLRDELAKQPRVEREPIERVKNPMRLVVYTFATPRSEQERRILAIKRAEARARDRRAALRTGSNEPSRASSDSSERRRPTVEPPAVESEPDLLDGDPFAPPPDHLDPVFEADCDEIDMIDDRFSSSLPQNRPDETQDPFGDLSDPFGLPHDSDPTPRDELSLDETGDLDLAYQLDLSGTLPIAEEELLRIITSVIEPASWVRDERAMAKVAHRRVMIRHTDSVHRKIRQLAKRLRVKDFRELDQSPFFGGFGGGVF